MLAVALIILHPSEADAQKEPCYATGKVLCKQSYLA